MSRKQACMITNMCMVRKGDQILVENRLSQEWPGITLPGGHAEVGESLQDAVVREMAEETGLTVKPRLKAVKDWNMEDGSRYLAFLYEADQFEGTLRSSKEGEVFWVKLEDVWQMDLAEGTKEILEMILNAR